MSSTCGDCIAGKLYDQPIEPGCIGCKYSLRRKGGKDGGAILMTSASHVPNHTAGVMGTNVPI